LTDLKQCLADALFPPFLNEIFSVGFGVGVEETVIGFFSFYGVMEWF
jgi:hypothetical protein